MKPPRKIFLILLMLVFIIALSGCISISRTELAWQAVHAVDVAQTLNIVNDPCYIESNPITTSLIGEQPSTGEVIAWGVGAGFLHYVHHVSSLKPTISLVCMRCVEVLSRTTARISTRKTLTLFPTCTPNLATSACISIALRL